MINSGSKKPARRDRRTALGEHVQQSDLRGRPDDLALREHVADRVERNPRDSLGLVDIGLLAGVSSAATGPNATRAATGD
jgi:hypothetical protein